MTIRMPARELDRLSASGLSPADLANLEDDLVGRAVYDRMGEEIGTVEDVLVSRELLRAPFLIVRWGGVLGIGRQQRLVPTESVDRIDGEAIYLSLDHEAVTNGPAYPGDADGDEAEAHYAQVYRHYGLEPYWMREPLP